MFDFPESRGPRIINEAFLKLYRNALWLSLAVSAFVVLAELVFIPAHQEGKGQDVLGFVDGAAHLMQLPGMTLSEVSGLRPKHRWTWPGFGVQVAANLVFYTVVFAVGLKLMGAGAKKAGLGFGIKAGSSRKLLVEAEVRGGEVMAESQTATGVEENAGEPRSKHSRRDLLLGLSRVSAGVAGACASWGFFVESRWFDVNRWNISIRGLPRELDGFRIVQLADIHHSTWMSIRWVRQIIDMANALSPDLVALTGDYVHRGRQYLRPVVTQLARLTPRTGVVGVMGNHDWWEGGGEVCKAAFAEFRIPLIDNGRIYVDPSRRLVKEASRGLCIAGVGDLWEDKCLYDAALDGVPGGMPRILLSHNPDVAEEPDFLRSGHRVDLMLSGHTHGGQIAIPLLGAPVTNSRYGQKYAKGLVQGPVCPVLISKGLGMTVMPIRFGVRPEIVEIVLCRSDPL